MELLYLYFSTYQLKLMIIKSNSLLILQKFVAILVNRYQKEKNVFYGYREIIVSYKTGEELKTFGG